MRIPFLHVDSWDLERRWLQRLARWRRRLGAWHDRRRRLYERLSTAAGRVEAMAERLESDSFHNAVKASIARSILAEMGKDEDVHLELLTEVRRELLASCRAEALELARQDLAAEFEARKVRLEDRLARDRAQYQTEANASIETGISAALERQEEDWRVTIQEARTQRNAARQERNRALDLLTDLIKQVCGPGKIYLFSRGVSELDLAGLNVALAPKGLRIRSELTESTRLVKTKLDGTGRSEARSQFWLEGIYVGEEAPEVDGLPQPLISAEVPQAAV